MSYSNLGFQVSDSPSEIQINSPFSGPLLSRKSGRVHRLLVFKPPMQSLNRRILKVPICVILLLAGEALALTQSYQVKSGDSLWSIARQFKISISELKRLNRLKTDKIYPGQKLHVGSSVPEFQTPNGPYYWYKPKRPAQQSRVYREASRLSPADDYKKARELLRAFNSKIEDKFNQNKSRKPSLRGWKIVLDPGHGGRDPGAIVSNKDGLKRAVYIVEDEYVSDLTLRIYQALKLHGAECELTVISPNHLIRENLQASVTFVHEQNEIYNDEKMNRKKDQSVRPALQNIEQRVTIANKFTRGSNGGKSLFISLHADNSPNRPKGPLVIYLNLKGKIDTRSRTFAQSMQKSLNDPLLPSQIAGRNLAVLRNNKAYAEILVEIRNVHDQGEAWALRSDTIRQRDVQRIVNGILTYARSR